MKIDDAVADALINLGSAGLPGVPESLSDETTAWALLMCGVHPWNAVGKRLNENQLGDLIRGLVLYSQASGWSGGSVSPVIQLYRIFAERFPTGELALNRWIIANRRYRFFPFGSSMFEDAASVAEHNELWAQHRRNRKEYRAREEEARLRQVAAAATAKLPNAVRRGDLAAVKALLQRGADRHVRDESGSSLVHIAEVAGRAEMVTFLRSLD